MYGGGFGPSSQFDPTEFGRQKGGSAEQGLRQLADCIERGLAAVACEQDQIGGSAEQVREVAETLDPRTGPCDQHRKRFASLQESFEQSQDLVCHHMAKVMDSFLPGLFVGGDDLNLPRDNLDLER